MIIQRLLTTTFLFLAIFSLSAADTVKSQTPRVLVIGKNGLSTNVEPSEAEALLASFTNNVAEEAEVPVETDTASNRVETVIVKQEVDWEPLVKTMEMMIEQQKVSMVAMEEARAQAVLSAQEASRAMQAKMDNMEAALSDQRAKDAESIARMNRLVVGVAAGFASVGFVVMVFTGWFFMRTMNRVSEINANLQTQLLALPQMQQQMVGGGGSANPASQRLIGALEQLEARIRELEHPVDHPESGSTGTAAHVDAEVISEDKAGNVGGTSENGSSRDITTMLAKGQTMLNLDKASEALACFNSAIEKDPANAEAHLKRGNALEKLRRFGDAIDAYDSALAANASMTMAYLAKGGLCNRLERYDEALDCYEKALQTQQRAAEHAA